MDADREGTSGSRASLRPDSAAKSATGAEGGEGVQNEIASEVEV